MSEKFKRSFEIVNGPDKFEIMLALFDNEPVEDCITDERKIEFSIVIKGDCKDNDDSEVINVMVNCVLRLSLYNFVIAGNFYPQRQNPEMLASIVFVNELNTEDGLLEYEIVYNIFTKKGTFKF